MFRLLVAFVIGTALTVSAFGQGRRVQSEETTQVRNVEYRSRTFLPIADRDETTRSLRNALNAAKPIAPDAARDVATECALAMLQNRGYWKPRIKTTLLQLPRRQGIRWFDVVFDIEEGPQYHLSEITWAGMKEFAEAELQRSMPIRPGEVASRHQIADGLESARKLYGTRGYINCTFVPDTEIDDNARTLVLHIDIDEGGQFHFGDLSLPGLDDAHREMLLQRWESMRGTLYSLEKEEAFFRTVLWPANPGRKNYDYLVYSEFLDKQFDEKERAVNFSILFLEPPPAKIVH